MKILIAFLLLASTALAADYYNPNNIPWDPDGPKVYDSDGNFMGNLNPDPHDPDSINNPHGIYGSPYQPDSVNFGEHERSEDDWDEGWVTDDWDD